RYRFATMCSPSNLHKSPQALTNEMQKSNCAHLPNCRIDQPASDADSSRQTRQIFNIFDVEPARVLDFRAVDPNFSAGVLGEERDHERVRERPRLAGEVPHPAHAHADLLMHLPLQTLLQSLTRLDESGQSAVDA